MRMRTHRAAAASVAVSILALVAICSAYPDPSASALTYTYKQATSPGAFIGEGINNIAAALLQESQQEQQGNVAFSPLGHSTILAALAEGASGKTRSQLLAALKLPQDSSLTRATYRSVLGRMREKNASSKPEFRSWFYVYKKSTKVEDSYESLLRDSYLMEIRDVEDVEEDTPTEFFTKKEEQEGEKQSAPDAAPAAPAAPAGATPTAAEILPDGKGEMPEGPTKVDSPNETEKIASAQEPMTTEEKKDAIVETESSPDNANQESERPIAQPVVQDTPSQFTETTDEEKKETVADDTKTGQGSADLLMKEPAVAQDTASESQLPSGETQVLTTQNVPVNEPVSEETRKEETPLKEETPKIEDAPQKGADGVPMNGETNMEMTSADLPANDAAPAMTATVQVTQMTDEAKGESNSETTDSPKLESVKQEMPAEPAMVDKVEAPAEEVIPSEPVLQDVKESNEKIALAKFTKNEAKDEKKPTGEKKKDEKKKGSRNSDASEAHDGRKPAYGPSLLTIFNALYYKGTWKTPFDAKFQDDFICPDGEKKEVTVLRTQGEFRTGDIKELNATAIELPYKGENGRYSLLVLLPKSHDGLPKLTEALTKFSFRHLYKSMKDKQVDVAIPEFEIDHISHPQNVFKKMGMECMLNKEKAEFPGISKSQHLYLQDDAMAQLVRFRLDDDTATANYLSAMSISTRSGLNVFRANHPFVFYLRDNVDNLSIVVGRVTDPSNRPKFSSLV